MEHLIIQLETGSIEDDEWMDDFYLDEIVCNRDGFSDVRDATSEEKENLRMQAKKLGVGYVQDTGVVRFPAQFARHYFENRFALLKQTVRNLSLEDFSGERDYPLVINTLMDLVDDRDGLFIYNDHEIYTFDDFIRGTPKEGFGYVIGNIMAYKR